MKKLACMLLTLALCLVLLPLGITARADALVVDAECSRDLEHPVYEYDSATRKNKKTFR